MIKNQKGQTLLIIIFAITLGLVALVGVSSRIVTSTKRVFIDNAYYKAQAVAEAGAEKFLLKSNSELKTLVDNNTCNPVNLYTPTGFGSSVSGNCILDLAESRAVVGVEGFLGGSEVTTNIPSNSMVGINLAGFSGNLGVCWTSTGYSDIYYFVYHTNGSSYEVNKDLYTCDTSFSAWCANPPSDHVPAGIKKATDVGGKSCFAISVPSGAITLQLMSVVNASEVTVGGINLPSQGYRITSVGEVKSSLNTSLRGDTATRKKVTVEKLYSSFTHPFLDFAITSLNGEVSAN